MMTKFTVVLTTLFLTMSSITADKVRGLRSGPHSDEGPRGTRRLIHNHDHDHDHGHGGRKGGFGGPEDDFGEKCAHIDEPALVDLSCPALAANEPDCAFRNGELATWLCRTMFDRFTGESDSYSTCQRYARASLGYLWLLRGCMPRRMWKRMPFGWSSRSRRPCYRDRAVGRHK
jgi:hypothetical protein